MRVKIGAFIAVGVLGASLVSCGAQASGSTNGSAQGAALPACAKAGTPIARPAEFPAAFPLPPGTVITSREDRSGGRIIINTVVPLNVKGVATFFERELPQAGFKPDKGESEPGEAEAEFDGNGYRGRWKTNDIGGCPGAATLTVLAQRD